LQFDPSAHQASYGGGALDNMVAKFTPPNPALRLQSRRSQNGAFHFEAAPLTATLPYPVERLAGWDGASAWAPVQSFTATSPIQSWAEATNPRTQAFYRVRSGAP